MPGPKLPVVADSFSPPAPPAPNEARAPQASEPKAPQKAPRKGAKRPSSPRAGGRGGEETRVDVYARIPEPVGLRLDEGAFELRRRVRGPKQSLVVALIDKHVRDAATLRALLAAYRDDLDAGSHPTRALFVRMPETVLDRLDRAVLKLRPEKPAPTRQEAIAAVIWCHAAEAEELREGLAEAA